MIHRTRAITFLFLLVLLVGVPVSLAQSDTFGLSQTDYSLLADANTQTAAASSFQFDYTSAFEISGVPGSNGTFNFSGRGTLITGSNPSLQLTLDGTSTTNSVPISAEFRLVDNILYVNTVDAATGRFTGWVGTPLDELASNASQMSGTPFNSGDLSSFDASQIGFLITAMQPERFVSMSREQDEPAAGRDAAHFIIDLDFDAFFSTPFVGAFMAQIATGSNSPSADDLNEALQGSTFSVEQWVGLDDSLIHRTLLDLTLNLDASALGGAAGQMIFGLNFDITLDGYDEQYTISAPEDAEIASTNGQTQPTTVPPPVIVEGGSIVANTPTAIQLGSQGTTDLIYTASGSETVNIIVRSILENGVDTTLEIIGPNGNTLAYNDDHNTTRTNLGNFDSAIENLVLPGPGNYTIRIGSYYNSGGGDVEILIESGTIPEVVIEPTAQPQIEPTAQVQPTPEPEVEAIPEPQSSILIPGTLEAGAGFTYSFDATRGQTVTIIVTDGDGPLNPHVSLLDPLFAGIAENDDHGTGWPQLDPQDSMIMDYVIQTDGTYYVLVNDTAGAAGSFELILVRGGGIPDLTEVRAGGSTTQVDLPTPESSSVAAGDEVTLSLDGRTPSAYTFEGTAGQHVTISAQAVNPPSPDMDVQITVYDPNGAQIAYNDDHGGTDPDLGQRDAQIVQLTLSASGTYRIEVDSWFDVRGDVLLTVEEG